MTPAARRIVATDLAAARALARCYGALCEVGYLMAARLANGPVCALEWREVQRRAYRLAPLMVHADLRERVTEIVALVEREARS